MKFVIIAVGKLKDTHYKELIRTYVKRLKHNLIIREVELKKFNNINSEIVKKEEGELIAKQIPHNSTIIIMDEQGDNFSSKRFANIIHKAQSSRVDNICFVIGGAYGLCSQIKSRGKYVLAFGRATWPHMMLRMMLVEQIYRAETIIVNHPYHK